MQVESYAVFRQAMDQELTGDNAAMKRGAKMVDNNVLAMSFSEADEK